MKKVILKCNLIVIAIFLNACSGLFHPAPSNLSPNNKLHQAVLDNDITEVENLLKNPFRSIDATSRGRTALAYAVIQNNYKIAKFLLENGATPDIPIVVTGFYPIHIAASNGNLEMVKLLVKYGSNPQLKTISPNDGEWTRTPITAAQANNHYKVVGYLKNEINNN